MSLNYGSKKYSVVKRIGLETYSNIEGAIIDVPDGAGCGTVLSDIYVKEAPNSAIGVVSYVSISELISQGRVQVTNVYGGYSETRNITNVNFSFDYDDGGASVSFRQLSQSDPDSQVVGTVKLRIRQVLELKKDDEYIKVGANYNRSTQWTAVFKNMNHNGSENVTNDLVQANGSIESGVKSASGDYTDSASYYYDDSVSGSRTLHVVDASIKAISAGNSDITNQIASQYYWDDETTVSSANEYIQGCKVSVYEDGSPVAGHTGKAPDSYEVSPSFDTDDEELTSHTVTLKYTYKNLQYEASFTIKSAKKTIVGFHVYAEQGIRKGNSVKTLANLGLITAEVDYNSGATEEVEFSELSSEGRFGVDNPNEIILDSRSLVFRLYGTSLAVNMSTSGWQAPTVSNSVLVWNDAPQVFFNNSSKIDLSNVKVQVYYSNAEYVNEIPYSDLTFSDNPDMGVSFDGSDTISISMTDNFTEVEITASGTDSLSLSSVTATKTITVSEINEIVGLRVIPHTVFSDYHIGDSFVTNSENADTTEIEISFIDNQNQITKTTLGIQTAAGYLNFEPLVGTVFSRTSANTIVTISSPTNSNIKCQYPITVTPKYSYSENAKRTYLFAKKLGGNGVFSIITQGNNIVTLPSDTYFLFERGTNPTRASDSIIRGSDGFYYIGSYKVYGYLTGVYSEGSANKNNAHVVLFNDFIQPTVGQSNIRVKFPVYSSKNADKINKCHFGQLFGNNNAKNRLFLSGNPDYPNFDWHSGPVNTSKIDGEVIDSEGNFSYFEDESERQYGQTDNKVMGYDIVSTDKMVVLKSRSDKEPTIYYRTSGLRTVTDGSNKAEYGVSGETLQTEEFPYSIGNIGPGLANSKGILNFNGDTLFLSSEHQIAGLDAAGIIGDSQRYANSRSRMIDPKLSEQDLEKVWLWTNNKYLFVILPDEIYTCHYEEMNGETKQYDWWRHNIPNVSAMMDIDGEVYFGTYSGEIYKLEHEAYSDCKKFFGLSIGVSSAEDSFSVSTNSNILKEAAAGAEKLYYHQEQGDIEDCIFYKVATLAKERADGEELDLQISGGSVRIAALDADGNKDEETVSRMHIMLREDRRFFFGKKGEAILNDGGEEITELMGVSAMISYSDDDLNEISFYDFRDKDGNKLDDGTYYGIVMTISECYLVSRLDGDYLMVHTDGSPLCSSDKGIDYWKYQEEYDQGLFKLYDNGFVDIVPYWDDQTDTESETVMNSQIKQLNSVKAYYITAPFTMGDLMHNKAIWSWSLTSDSGYPSKIDICQAVNDEDFKELSEISTSQDRGLDYGDLSYETLDFTKHIVPYVYTFYSTVLVPFICFGLRNNKDENAVLSSLQVLYTKPSGTFGGSR